MEQAKIIMLQKLILEVARLHGTGGAEWIDRFRNAVVTEINDAMAGDGLPQQPEVVAMSQSVVAAVSQMAKDRYVQLRDEGLL